MRGAKGDRVVSEGELLGSKSETAVIRTGEHPEGEAEMRRDRDRRIGIGVTGTRR
jgi:hypothetical protein